LDVDLKVVSLSGGDLAAIPREERILLVQFAHLHNTINVIRRWLLSSEESGASDAERHAAVTQRGLATRMLCGVLNEGSNVLERSLLRTRISEKYHPRLTAEGQRLQERVVSYFCERNVIKTVRNRFAFHFDRPDVDRQIHEVAPEQSFPLYVCEEQGNSLYYLAEEVVGVSMLRVVGSLIDADDPTEALRGLQSEVLEISGAFDRVIAEYLAIILLEYFEDTKWRDAEDMQIENVPPIDEIRTPFFVGRPRARTTS
jgi:hypothetical protein